MAATKWTWTDEIREVLQELGGEAHIRDIESRILQRRKKPLENNEHLPSTISSYLQYYSSDSKTYWGKGDYFCLVERGAGVWKLRNPVPPPMKNDIISIFENAIAKSQEYSSQERKARIAKAPKIPKKIIVTTTIFLRNPDVVVEVLIRANGRCEKCKKEAPFNRRKDNSPYLEVHHRISLANGGEDTEINAIALCPNCHRKAHYA